MKKILLLIFFILIIIGLIGGVLYLIRGKQNKPQLTNSTEVIGWKTYTNSQYSFKISFPSDWEIYEAPKKDFISFSPPGTSTDDEKHVNLNIIPFNTKSVFSTFSLNELTKTTLVGKSAQEKVIVDDVHDQYFDYIQITNVSGTKWNQFNEIMILIDYKENLKFLPTMKRILTTLKFID